MAISEQDIMEDLAYADPEGPADMMEDEFDPFNEYESDFAGSGDFGEDEGDYFSGEDDFEADEADETVGQMLSGVLGAEDEDEFLGKLFSGAKNLIKKAAPVVGKIARGAAPILSMIPHPAAQVAGRVAGMLGKLKAEGASIEDALEAVAEVAARDPRALPVVVGLASRSVIKNRGASMPPAQRQQVAKTMNKAARTLVSSGGPNAIRALPKITQSVKRTAGARGASPAVQPRVIARTAAKVAQNPNLLRRLSSPSRRAQSIAHRANGGGGNGGSRTIRVPGPATITIDVG
jgi:hypothetical protein